MSAPIRACFLDESFVKPINVSCTIQGTYFKVSGTESRCSYMTWSCADCFPHNPHIPKRKESADSGEVKTPAYFLCTLFFLLRLWLDATLDALVLISVDITRHCIDLRCRKIYLEEGITGFWRGTAAAPEREGLGQT